MRDYNSKLLSDLDFYCTKAIRPPEYIQSSPQTKRLAEMEQQIYDHFGDDFLAELGLLQCKYTDWEVKAHFQAGLQCGFQLAKLIQPD